MRLSMLNIKNFLLFPLACFISLSAYAAAETPTDPNMEMVNQTVNQFIKKNNIPGIAIETYVDGVPHSYYFGYANLEKKTPITKNTIFEIGSISKVMTCIILAQEIDFAKLNLDDEVTKYVPNLSESFDDISLKDLATYTSGLPFSVPKDIKTKSELEKYLSTVVITDEVGSEWKYSSFGMGLLGYVLEDSMHKNYDQIYRNRILNPLGMQPQITLTVPAVLQKFYAHGYDKDGKPVAHFEPQIFPAAGGLKASAGDMQRFLSAAIGLPGTPERLFYPIRMTQSAYIKTPDFLGGLAWLIHPIKSDDDIISLLDVPEKMNFGPLTAETNLDKVVFDGNALIDKTGTTDGFRSYIAVIPNKKSGIVILTNRNISNKEIVGLGRELLFKMSKIYVEKPKVENQIEE